MQLCIYSHHICYVPVGMADKEEVGSLLLEAKLEDTNGNCSLPIMHLHIQSKVALVHI